MKNSSYALVVIFFASIVFSTAKASSFSFDLNDRRETELNENDARALLQVLFDYAEEKEAAPIFIVRFAEESELTTWKVEPLFSFDKTALAQFIKSWLYTPNPLTVGIEPRDELFVLMFFGTGAEKNFLALPIIDQTI